MAIHESLVLMKAKTQTSLGMSRRLAPDRALALRVEPASGLQRPSGRLSIPCIFEVRVRRCRHARTCQGSGLAAACSPSSLGVSRARA